MSKPNEQSGIDGALEKKWRDELRQANPIGECGVMSKMESITWAYLQACRARQSEIDSWKQSYLLEAHHCLVHRKEIESLKAEIAKRDELLRDALKVLQDLYVGCDEWEEKVQAILKENNND